VELALHPRQRIFEEVRRKRRRPTTQPAVVTIAGALAIPLGGAAGWSATSFTATFFKDALPRVEGEFHGLLASMAHAGRAAFWLASPYRQRWYLYLKRTDLPQGIANATGSASTRSWREIRLDDSMPGCSRAGRARHRHGFWRGGDLTLIDGLMVNGSARLVGWSSSVVRLFQTRYVLPDAFTMLIGVVVLASSFLRT